MLVIIQTCTCCCALVRGYIHVLNLSIYKMLHVISWAVYKILDEMAPNYSILTSIFQKFSEGHVPRSPSSSMQSMLGEVLEISSLTSFNLRSFIMESSTVHIQ